MNRFLLGLLLLPILASCGGIDDSKPSLSPTQDSYVRCTANPAYPHASRFGNYQEIVGKASGKCAVTTTSTVFVWTSIDKQIGTGPGFTTVVNQPVRAVDMSPYQTATFTQKQLFAVVKSCQKGTYRTVVNYYSNKRVQVKNHIHGGWIGVLCNR